MRFAQCARGAFRCAIRALGEFRFQLIDFFHAALQFRAERGDFFLGEAVEGHFPNAMRDDLAHPVAPFSSRSKYPVEERVVYRQFIGKRDGESKNQETNK